MTTIGPRLCNDDGDSNENGKKKNIYQGHSQDFSKGGVTEATHQITIRGLQTIMVYTAAFPRVSAGSVVLSQHEGPYYLKTRAIDKNTLQKNKF